MREPYIKGKTRCIDVRCREGHTWSPSVNNLAQGHWCSACHGNASHTIADMRAIAAIRNGECLSETYSGLATHLKWRCEVGHVWEATPNNVKNHHSWCPECRIYIGEALVRATLEEALNPCTFVRTQRVPWMDGMELDGYNEEKKLAFEYQGIQHAMFVPYFHGVEENYLEQVKRDNVRARFCAENGVALMLVPHTVDHNDLRGWVRRELERIAFERQEAAEELRLVVLPKIGTESEFYDRVRTSSTSNAMQFARLRAVVTRKGGVLISTKYTSYRADVHIRCANDHDFYASLEDIDQPEHRGPRFCPHCAHNAPLDDDIIRTTVESVGYALESTCHKRSEDGRSRRYVTVVCPQGHKTEKMWDNFVVKDGVLTKGCEVCGQAKKGNGRRGDIAEACDEIGMDPVLGPDEKFVNANTRYTWQCRAKGHIVVNTLRSLKNRSGIRCTCCKLDAFEDKYHCVVLTTNVDGLASTAKIECSCYCGLSFDTTVMTMGRRKTFCPCDDDDA